MPASACSTTAPWGGGDSDLAIVLCPGQARALLIGAGGRWLPPLPLYPGMRASGTITLRPALPPALDPPPQPDEVQLSAQLGMRLHSGRPQAQLRLSPSQADALLASVLTVRLGSMCLSLHPRSGAITTLSGAGAASGLLLRIQATGVLELSIGASTEQAPVSRLDGTVQVRCVRTPAGLVPSALVHLEAIEVQGPQAQMLDSDLSRIQIESLVNASLAASLAKVVLPSWCPTDIEFTGGIGVPAR